MVTKQANKELDKIYALLAKVSDPEIPVLSIMDMGVVYDVQIENNTINIQLTPTYTGCPAMDTIADDIKTILQELPYEVTINMVLSPAWSTDKITEKGRKALEDYGIAAPLSESKDKQVLLEGKRLVKCTNCGSTNTKLVSQFGSTACKALFQCEDCQEPFDYFKCLK